MQNIKDIRKSVQRLFEAQALEKRAKAHLEDVKQKEGLKISNYMFSNLGRNENSFEIEIVENNNGFPVQHDLRVTRVRRRTVNWDIDKLKKKMSRRVFKAITDRTYTINDMDGLTAYLKQCGVDPKRFKEYIDVSEKVNEVKLDMSYDKGILEESDVEGCYTVEFGSPYIKLYEIENNE